MLDKVGAADLSVIRSINITIQDRMQPRIRSLYKKACEIFPDSLIMSEKYYEAKEYLRAIEGERESDDLIRSIQVRLLTRTLKNALKSVRFYKREVKIDPDRIREDNAIEMLHKFPFIEKQDIMKNPTDFISKNFSNHFLFYATTGGSTGKGIGLWKKYDEYQVMQAFIEHMWGKFGYQRKSKVLRIGSDAISPLNKPPCRIDGKRLLVSPRHMNDKWLPEIVQKIDEFQPDFIHSYPSCLEVLAGHLRASRRGLSVKGIFLASEEVKQEQLDFFHDVFAAPICFHYGAGENVLLGNGCYDGEKVCYHLNPVFGFAENLEDELGHELVGTGFWNDAMPLIRYRTQDYGRLVEDQTGCQVCGKAWKTVCQLDGRKQYYLTTKHGTRFAGLSISCGVDKFIWDYVSSFQYVQNRPGEIELHLIPRSSMTQEIEAKILAAQRKRLADWFDPVTIVKETEIPLTASGKRRLVVVNLPERPS